MPARDYLAKDYYQGPTVAQTYDRVRFRSPLGRVRHLLDTWTLRRCLSDVPAGSRVLDIACGTGRITEMVAGQGFTVTGTDVSRSMLEVARRRLRRAGHQVDFFVADAERLPVAESSFRAATSIRFMGNVPREVRVGVLRAAGEAADLVIVDYTVRTRFGDLRRRLLSPYRSRPRHYTWSIVSERQLAAELREANLSVRRRAHLLPVLSDAVYLVLERRA